MVETLTTEAILGLDFLESQGATLDFPAKILHLRHGQFTLPMDSCGHPFPLPPPVVTTITTLQDLSLPANSEVEVLAKILGIPPAGSCLLESNRKHPPLEVARALVQPYMVTIPVRLLNPSSGVIRIFKGQTLGTLEPIEQDSIPVSSVQQGNPPVVSSSKEAILQALVDGASTTLDDAQREMLFLLLVNCADVFSEGPEDLGRTSVSQHEIVTGEAAPIKQAVRRLGPAERETVKELLNKMQSQNVIQPSSSPWASPIVLVRKKNGTHWFCVDYRKVNAVTRKDAYPLPCIDDILDALAGSRLFSMLDLISGYWQVEVAPQDRSKTAFCTTERLFEFTGMPFGLCNAPATFQRLMDLVLTGLHWLSCLVYLDDIVIFGKSFEEHLTNLASVLQRLRDANLKLQPAKCGLCKDEINFLGHVVSADGVATDPSNIVKVKEWPTPTNGKEVQQFLGLAMYYCRFIKGFATIAKPLHRLTEKGANFTWTDACSEAFATLKTKLTSTPILAFPDFSGEFILDTDASGTGIGAVLSQVQDGMEKVISYAGRTLSKAERNYCVTRRELLAVVHFTEHFKTYLRGKKFHLRTDHGLLTWLRNFKEPEGQVARWIERLQEFDFTIEHRQGRIHSNADALSRRPCVQCGRESHVSPVSVLSIRDSTGHSGLDLRQAQLDDPMVGPILRAKEKGHRPDAEAMRGEGAKAQRLCQIWDQLTVRDNILHRI